MGGWKWAASLSHSPSCPGLGQALQRLSVHTSSSEKHAGGLAALGLGSRASGFRLHGHLGATPGTSVSFPGDLQAHRGC